MLTLRWHFWHLVHRLADKMEYAAGTTRWFAGQRLWVVRDERKRRRPC